MPLSHPRVAHRQRCRPRTASRSRATDASSTSPNRMLELIFAGVFDRFPRAADGRGRGRLRVGALLQGADRQQLPAPRARAATSRSSACRASTSSSTSTSRSSPTRSACAAATTIGVERMLWSCDYPHVSRRTGRTRGARSNAFSGVPHEERGRCSPATRSASTGSDPQASASHAPTDVGAQLALGHLAARRAGSASTTTSRSGNHSGDTPRSRRCPTTSSSSSVVPGCSSA